MSCYVTCCRPVRAVYDYFLLIFNTKTSIFSVLLWFGISIYSSIVFSYEYNHIKLQQTVDLPRVLKIPDTFILTPVLGGNVVTNRTANDLIDTLCFYYYNNQKVFVNRTLTEDKTSLIVDIPNNLYFDLYPVNKSSVRNLQCVWNSLMNTSIVNVAVKLGYYDSIQRYSNHKGIPHDADTTSFPFLFDCTVIATPGLTKAVYQMSQYVDLNDNVYNFMRSCAANNNQGGVPILTTGLISIKIPDKIVYQFIEVRSRDLTWFWSQISPLSPFFSFVVLGVLRVVLDVSLWILRKCKKGYQRCQSPAHHEGYTEMIHHVHPNEISKV
jgi:hypothetical protein